ncbi:unnamed protein product [Rangifer tarandus platyrhynchus]|uniref:Uncharacterized protein n=2 Tax=Rangifer tarandus platyrhynchus TaxID=3082113 RepID=A0AC59YDA5_RANTA|nr:unnamed protein product [Rangifer tarandus platyrhynchus]
MGSKVTFKIIYILDCISGPNFSLFPIMPFTMWCYSLSHKRVRNVHFFILESELCHEICFGLFTPVLSTGCKRFYIFPLLCCVPENMETCLSEPADGERSTL